jgi:hypothetical protein
VLEHGRAVALDVVIEPDAMARPGQDIVADLERIAAQVVSIRSKA